MRGRQSCRRQRRRQWALGLAGEASPTAASCFDCLASLTELPSRAGAAAQRQSRSGGPGERSPLPSSKHGHRIAALTLGTGRPPILLSLAATAATATRSRRTLPAVM